MFWADTVSPDNPMLIYRIDAHRSGAAQRDLLNTDQQSVYSMSGKSALNSMRTRWSTVVLTAACLLGSVVLCPAWDTNEWEFLDTIQRTHFKMFRETKVGPYELPCDTIIYDNPYNFGISASGGGIGFKLAAMCIGHYRGWVSYDEAYGEVLRLLRAFANELSSDPAVFRRDNGWIYHFYDTGNGTVYPKDNSSPNLLEHMLLMGGVITAGEYFKGTEAGDLALRLYSETQWDWMGDGSYTGWGYSENLLAIIEAADAPQHNKHSTASNMWNTVTASDPYHLPLYYWQYPHCFIDFRSRWDPRGINHADRALQTILHQRTWCTDRFNEAPTLYETYTNNTFGLSACGSSVGYRILNAIDEWSCDSGSISPICIPPCMVYAGTETMATMKYLYDEYYIKGWTSPRIPIWSDVYGFANCYNIGQPSSGGSYYYNGWNADIDYGPNVLMLENYRLGTTWRYFMQNPCIATAMQTVGFGPVQIPAVADFTNAVNQFGGSIGSWGSGSAAFVWGSTVNPFVAGHFVRIEAGGAGTGGWIDLGGRDQRARAQVSFWAKAQTGNERIRVGMKDVFNRENKVDLLLYTGGTMPTNWTQVRIPIEAFCITGVISNDIWPGNLSLLSFEFTNSAGGGLDVDYVSFGVDTLAPATPTGPLHIAHFGGHPRVHWGPMSRERDVAGYSLWRRTGGTGEFVRAARLLAPAHQGYGDDTDYNGLAGQVIEYALRAVDNSGAANSSESGPSNSFTYIGGGKTDVDFDNGHNPNTFGGTNDGYWGAATTQSFDFVQALLPYGWTGWVRRSFVSTAVGGHTVDMANGGAGDSWALAFYIRGAIGGEGIRVGLQDSGSHEVVVDVAKYIGGPIGTNWARVVVPFSDFTNVTKTSLNNISFAHTTSGTVLIADLGFITGQRPALLDDHLMEAEHPSDYFGGRVRDFKFAASEREVLGDGWGGSTNHFAEYHLYFDQSLTGQVLNVRYACGDGNGRVINLLWDGVAIGGVTCTNTGGWGEQDGHFQWASCALPVVTSGWHSLKWLILTNDSSVNADCFTVTEWRPWFRECEGDDFQIGSSGRDWKAGASGGEVLGMSWGQTSTSVAVYSNVGTHAIGGAWLHLWYSLSAMTGRVLNVFVDGIWKAQLVCPPTGGWGDHACDFDRASAFLGELSVGPHVVQLAVPGGGQAINLDCFSISKDPPDGLAQDSDDDGLSDRQEGVTGTSASTTDSDGDGISDGDEIQFGKSGQVSDPKKADTDGDGMDDLAEAISGTDPWDEAEFFQCLENSVDSYPTLGRILRWNSETGRFYSVSVSTNLLNTDFWLLTSGIPATPMVNVWTDTVSPDNPMLIYRIDARR